jgi:hypothetical protein
MLACVRRLSARALPVPEDRGKPGQPTHALAQGKESLGHPMQGMPNKVRTFVLEPPAQGQAAAGFAHRVVAAPSKVRTSVLHGMTSAGSLPKVRSFVQQKLGGLPAQESIRAGLPTAKLVFRHKSSHLELGFEGCRRAASQNLAL